MNLREDFTMVLLDWKAKLFQSSKSLGATELPNLTPVRITLALWELLLQIQKKMLSSGLSIWSIIARRNNHLKEKIYIQRKTHETTLNWSSSTRRWEIKLAPAFTDQRASSSSRGQKSRGPLRIQEIDSLSTWLPASKWGKAGQSVDLH